MAKGKVEAVAEKKFVAECKRRRVLSLKMSIPGWRNWPDQQVLIGQGHVFYIEFKRQGEVPRDGQLYRHAKLRSKGYSVYVCDTYEDAVKALETELHKQAIWL